MTAQLDNELALLLRARAIESLHTATAIYTAEPVVEELLGALDWPRDDRRLVDPSCGDGAFLCAALQKLIARRTGIDDASILDILEGWELHPGATEQARARVAAILRTHGRSASVAVSVADRMIRQADFLTEGVGRHRYHAVAGNPPYLRFVNVPKILREEYRACLPDYACADLLHGFLDCCANALFPDGEIALVTADRWLTNQGATKLRSSLGHRLSIHSLRRLDPNTTFYRPKQRRAGTPPRIHPVAVVLRPLTPDTIQLTGAPVYPDHLGAPAVGPTLGDVANVSLAPWLGSPGIFVVNRETADTLPKDHLSPAIDTDDICDGQLQAPRRYAIRTRPDELPPPAIMAHLDANLHRMAPRGRRKQPWMPPESWHRRRLDQPLLLVPRIARSLRPVRVPAGILPINHNLSIVAAGELTLDEIEAILCSEAANRWVRAHAAPLEGGFYSLTTTLLRQLPIGGQEPIAKEVMR